MSRNKPTTIVLSVRADLRDIAIVALWLNNKGQGAQSMGELGRRAIELLSDMIKKQDPSLAIMLTSDAINQLDQMGLKRGERNNFSLVKQLQLEDAVLELSSPTQPVMSSDIATNIAEAVRKRQVEESSNKDKMKTLTDALGGAVDGGEYTDGES